MTEPRTEAGRRLLLQLAEVTQVVRAKEGGWHAAIAAVRAAVAADSLAPDGRSWPGEIDTILDDLDDDLDACEHGDLRAALAEERERVEALREAIEALALGAIDGWQYEAEADPAVARDRGFNHTGPCVYMCGTCGEPPPKEDAVEALREAADRTEVACRRFITGTFDRGDEAMARMALDDLRALLAPPAEARDRGDFNLGMGSGDNEADAIEDRVWFRALPRTAGGPR